MTAEPAANLVDEEGFLPRDEVHALALGDLAPFGACVSAPVLVVVENDGECGVPADRAFSTGDGHSKTTVHAPADSAPVNLARYANRLALVAKRPGNPFPDMVTVGRGRNADVVLGLDVVSKLHAVFCEEGGQWLVRDFHSTNGTYVNGERLKPKVNTPIKSGDVLGFGVDVEFRFLEPRALREFLRA